MTNFINGEKLLDEAKIYFDEIKHLYEKKAWNPTVRRAQEVVELSIKSLLKLMGVDYPKQHDVSKILPDVLKKRGLEISTGELEEIVQISGKLVEDRSPAFYYERDYTQPEAREAKEKATKVLKFASNLSKILRKDK